MIDAKSAVKQAASHFKELMEGETIANLGLEEVNYYMDENEWHVVLGFQRYWPIAKDDFAGMIQQPSREYRLLALHADSGALTSMRLYKPKA